MPLWFPNIRDRLNEMRLESGVFVWVFLALLMLFLLGGAIWLILGI